MNKRRLRRIIREEVKSQLSEDRDVPLRVSVGRNETVKIYQADEMARKNSDYVAYIAYERNGFYVTREQLHNLVDTLEKYA